MAGRVRVPVSGGSTRAGVEAGVGTGAAGPLSSNGMGWIAGGCGSTGAGSGTDAGLAFSAAALAAGGDSGSPWRFFPALKKM
jgi:hypothetical protein